MQMHEFFPTKTATAVAMAAVLLIAGCGALPERAPRPTLYDFGPDAAVTVAAKPALPPITLADIDANARLDSTEMFYRLGYADANAVRSYGQSRWSQAPAQLLRQRLRAALAATRSSVLGPEESATIARAEGRVPDTLRVKLEEFSHFFDSPASSAGLIHVNVTLIRTGPGGDHVLAQRSFTARQPASGNDAPGGVKALAAASDAVVAEIVAWVNQPR
jgi:cholesterol transport system auxiliary component